MAIACSVGQAWRLSVIACIRLIPWFRSYGRLFQGFVTGVDVDNRDHRGAVKTDDRPRARCDTEQNRVIAGMAPYCHRSSWHGHDK
jgi:hypothetical protein